jgi:hypothetical protein
VNNELGRKWMEAAVAKFEKNHKNVRIVGVVTEI